MESVNFELRGGEAVRQKLDALANPALAKRLATKAARKAMALVRNAAVANAKLIDDPDTAEQLSKDIVVRAGKVRNKGNIRIRVGMKGGSEFWTIHKKMVRKNKAAGKWERVPNPWYDPKPNNVQYWWHVELGTQYSRAMPFLRPALTNNIQVATDLFASEFRAGIDDALRGMR